LVDRRIALASTRAPIRFLIFVFVLKNLAPVFHASISVVGGIASHEYDGSREILQIGLGDSKLSRSVITMSAVLSSGTLSPDGRKFIVSVGEEKSDVWLMRNFDPNRFG
jgi:hypothetical protein